MKQKKKTPMLLLPCAVIAAIYGPMTYFACSADDEFESNYEMETLAKGKMKLSLEPDSNNPYPSANKIYNNTCVRAKMDEVWQTSLSNSSSSGWREYAFYIYYSFSGDSLYCGQVVSGPIYTSCLDSVFTVPLSQPTNAYEVCAFFHTHPTLQYCSVPGNYRKTGPSNQDERFAQANGLPGIVYDFGQPYIYCGISPYSSKSVRFFGPYRRKFN